MASLTLKGINLVFSTLPTKFIWKYQDKNSTYQKFDRSSTRKLENAYKTNGSSGSYEVKAKGITYACNFSTMQWDDPNDRGYRKRARPITREPDVSPNLQMLIDTEDVKETYLKNNRKKIGTLFNQFKDQDVFEEEGRNVLDIVAFAEAMDIDLAQLDILILCYYCHAVEYPIITEDEFIEGLGRLECNNVSQLKNKITTKIGTINYNSGDKPSAFMTYLFKYLFLLFKSQCSTETKRLPLEIEETGFQLLPIMDLLFQNKWNTYTHFKQFIELCMVNDCPAWRMTQLTSYGEDEWNMTLKFACSYPNGCSNYEDGAWPSMFDSFGEIYWSKVVNKKLGETKN